MSNENQWNEVDPLMQAQGELVLRKLVDAGYPSFFVGGCVRDELMSRSVHDMDIASSAKPEEVIALFDHVIPTGLQHGTVTVMMEKIPFEVTTFRTESTYGDHRRPSSVEFVSDIIEDLKRRDFTMNAIARDVNGELTDPFGGVKDIETMTLRCVGKASERFDEDALRMLRAIRFASVFSFKPVKSLWVGLISERVKLKYIAIERVRAELEKVVLGPDPLYGLALLERSGLYQYFKVPLNWSGHKNLSLLTGIPLISAENPCLRWSLLMQGLGYTGLEAVNLMKSWTFSNEEVDLTTKLMTFDELWQQQMSTSQDEESLRNHWITLELQLGKLTATNWLEREKLLQLSDKYKLLSGWHHDIPIHEPGELNVNGQDLLADLGRQGGPWLGAILKELTYLVASGQLPNEKQDLLEWAQRKVSQDGT